MIKDGDTYCDPEFMMFKDEQLCHYTLEEKAENGCLRKTLQLTRPFSQTKHKFVNDNRIRFYEQGKTLMVKGENESETVDTVFKTDYEKIVPTETELSADEIRHLKFNAEWNDEKIRIIFNVELYNPIMQQINKELNREGQKLMLEHLEGTYFIAIYYNGNRETLVPIRKIDKNKIELYGFPEEPYEVIGTSTPDHAGI